jgi:hypothetical protein
MSFVDHPRRPKGTPKTGGRQKGMPNKRTLALRMGLIAAGAPPDLATPPEEAVKPPRQQPLEFLLNVMEDESHPIATRVDAAKAAAPYVHFRKGLIDTNGRDVPLTVQVIRFGDMTSKPEPVMIEHDSNEAA